MRSVRRGQSVGPPTSAPTRLIQSVAPLVLLGLWLMHGMSATTGAGCHGVALMMPMSASVGETQPIAAGAAAPLGTSASRPESQQQGSGELCLSGRPPSPGDFLLALLATLAVVALALFAHLVPRPAGKACCTWQRRGPPGPVGRQLLTAVCVSRT